MQCSPPGRSGTISLFLFVGHAVEWTGSRSGWLRHGMLCCLQACFHTATLAPDCVGNLRRFRQLSAYCATLYLVSFVEASGRMNLRLRHYLFPHCHHPRPHPRISLSKNFRHQDPAIGAHLPVLCQLVRNNYRQSF